MKKNIFSILVSLIIMYLSLTPTSTFDSVSLLNIPSFDKLVHLGMYFVLMSVITFENRKNLKVPANLFLAGLIPFFYGIFLEILQSALTLTRKGDIIDALSNSAGILLSISLWLLIRPLRKLIIR